MNKKDIVSQIKKMASDNDLIKTAKPPPTQAPTGGGVGPVYTGAGIPEVKEMQLAMQEVSRVVTRDMDSTNIGTKPNDKINTPAGMEEKKSKKAFVDFIAEQYVGSLKPEQKGAEWKTDKGATSFNQKKPTDIYALDAVMDNIQRIGKEKSELIADGNWSFRTNNALRNIMGFAHALLQLETDFGLPNTTYKMSDLQNLNKILNSYTIKDDKVMLTPDKQKYNAKLIVPHLKGIESLYLDFRSKILAQGEYRKLIEGNKEFDSYTSDTLSDSENSLVQGNGYRVTGITYLAPGTEMDPNKPYDYIPLKTLSDKDEFLKWVRDVMHVPNYNEWAPKLLKVIKDQIDKPGSTAKITTYGNIK